MMVLAIDPGTTESGWVLLDGTKVIGHGKDEGYRVMSPVVGTHPRHVLIEFPSPRGMRLGVELMETLRWAGRFEQAAIDAGHPVVRISRDEVKRTLLGRSNVPGADAAIRAILADRYAAIAGDPTGGRRAAVGTKAKPGPLYGVRADAWAALALAVAWMDGARPIEVERAARWLGESATAGRS